MDEDAPVDSSDAETIQWRRDASTSRTVRLLWSLGVGTFFAAITIIVCWRLYDLAAQADAGAVVLAVLAAVVATVLAFAVGDTERRLAPLANRLPVDAPSGRSLERATDAVLGTIAMMGVIGALMGAGRIVSQRDLLGGVGAGPFTGAAALSIPLALVALVLASFLRSVGALDREEGVIYLYEPDQAIDLAVVRGVSTRRLGDAEIVSLEYAQPDGQYVPGPRRIVVPPEVARELESLLERQPSA